MYNDLTKAIRAVQVINDIILDEFNYDEDKSVMLRTDGNCFIIEWLDFLLYSSSDEERDFDDTIDDWVPIKNYLIEKCISTVHDINLIDIEKLKGELNG